MHQQMDDESSADMNAMSEGSSCAGHESGADEALANQTNQSVNEVVESSDSNESSRFADSPVSFSACTHCLSHSQPAPNRFSLSSGESSRNHDAAAAPVVKLPLALPPLARLLPSYDHGPPGQTHLLFVLNSIFRI